MNALSQILYYGNVANNAGPAFVIFGSIFFIVFIIAASLSMFYDGGDSSDDNNRVRRNARPYAWLFGILFPILIVSAAFCPSKDTVYAIAASQLGEHVIKTPLASKAEQALEAWLNRQITPIPATNQ